MADLPHLSYKDLKDAHDFLNVYEPALKQAKAAK